MKIKINQNGMQGVWYVPDDVAEQIRRSPPKPGTLFGLPVVIDRGKESGSDIFGILGASQSGSYLVAKQSGVRLG
jgi:hypothetical protein